MTSSCDDKNRKSELLYRVSDITAKINVAVDKLIAITQSETRFINECDAKDIRNAINDITSTATLILTDAVSDIAPEELDRINLSLSLRAPTDTSEPSEYYNEELLSNLPDVAKEIISQIGVNAAMKLFKNFGGATFPIGKGIRYLGGTHAMALRTILTEDEIKRLQCYFSGEILYLPRCDRLLREVRNRKFLREFAEMRSSGATTAQCMSVLPPKFGFSDRYGFQLLKNERDSRAG